MTSMTRMAMLAATLLATAGGDVQAQRVQPEPATRVRYAESLSEWQRAIGIIGYVYGAPLFELATAEYRQVNGLAREVAGPHGRFAHFRSDTRGALADHTSSWFKSPNPDVLYSSAWIDLSDDPWVIFVPKMDDIWYSVQVEDYFMNNTGYLSSRTIGGDGGFYLLAGDKWTGKLPWGVRDVIRAPTDKIWVLLRIAASDANQERIVENYRSAFRLMSMKDYSRNPRRALSARPSEQKGVATPKATNEMRGTAQVFEVINALLRANPTPEADSGLLQLFDQAGFGPRHVFDLRRLPAAMRATFDEAAKRGAQALDELRYRPYAAVRQGWSEAPTWLGRYGQDYLLRGLAAYGGIGANDIEEAIYFNAYYDSRGRELDGEADYDLRFGRGGYPPAAAFWSLSVYDAASRQLIDNPIKRYSIGSLNEGLVYGEDGSLTIHLSAVRPKEESRAANWLPTPRGDFYIIARIYAPLPEALDGSYVLPPVVRQRRLEDQPPL